MPALLAQAHDDEVAYRDYRDRYAVRTAVFALHDALDAHAPTEPTQRAALAYTVRFVLGELAVAAHRLEQGERFGVTWERFTGPDTEALITDLHARGLSIREIARTVGCSLGTAHRIITKLGLNHQH
jgi:DNA-directed RNA polymerase specialized sigma24 family protein